MLDLFRNGKTEVAALDPSSIRTDGGTQMRATLDEGTITEYAMAMQAGALFPTIVVYYDGESYWLGDGFHRLAAHKRIFDGLIDCEVRSGTRRDAVLCAAGANAVHGLRRTNADKRRAVEALLRDEEWAQWSDREIARKCNVSHHMVAELRSAHTGNSPSMETERTFVHHRTGRPAAMKTGNIAAANRERKTLEATAPLVQPTNQPTEPAREPPRPLVQLEDDIRQRDKRLPLATAMRDVIGDVIKHMGSYGELTGCFTDVPPAERALKKMRDELQKLIDALEGGNAGQIKTKDDPR